MQRVLLIDGNYFAQRCLGAENMGEKINNLITKIEQQNFLVALNNSLINLCNAFKPYVDNVIFTTDNFSWRKEVEPFKPYYVDDKTLIGYKEQRKEKKEESPIDYDNFYKIYRDFVEGLKANMVVFDINGLEGDDNLMLIGNKIKDNKNIEAIVFCTDGDLVQVVKDNVFLLRNIKSKEAPFGEFVINYKKYLQVFDDHDAKAALLGNTLNTSYYKTLFSMNLFNNSKVVRKLHQGINIAKPYRTALLKSICGDKKDNIFSLLSWKSKTGTMNYKLTENHLEKAMRSHGYELSENACMQILNNKDLLINLLITLKTMTKQEISIDVLGDHLKHNLKMNVLSRNNIPEKYLTEFENVWASFENEILTGKFNYSIFDKVKVNKIDKSTEILQNSIPDLEDILNK